MKLSEIKIKYRMLNFITGYQLLRRIILSAIRNEFEINFKNDEFEIITKIPVDTSNWRMVYGSIG